MTKESTEAAGPDGDSHTRGLLTDAQAWEAVQERDRRFDGLFVYAVSTTGIYCRPSCPARNPRREHVAFYATPRAAEAAGYRACRRCRPGQADGTPIEQAVEHARAYLNAHLDEQVTLEQLGEEADVSPHHLQRAFKQYIGLSPREYQNMRRMECFKEHVGADSTVLEATYEAGFGSSRALYEQAEAGLGMTPGTYRRGGEGLDIRYTIVVSSFGNVLVAATERGVCAVSLGQEETTLVKDLEAEFPNAVRFERDDEAMQDWAGPIVRYLDGVHAHPTVPLDLQGTDFQRRVWRTLQEIPYGETRSYSEVAEMLGQPKAARAVAQACARNKAALVVPCHRVVRKDGAYGGYRWGSATKERLLRQEQADAGRTDDR